MTEEYLHFIFRTKLLGNQFVTSLGESLKILDFGIHNHNSGPDFLESKIKLGGQVWAGQIEFHVKSSDWLKHKHQFDPNYKNVIAHFVFQHDQEIKSGEYLLPTVELKTLIDYNHFTKYKQYLKSKSWVPCASEIGKVDSIIVQEQKEMALNQRLKRKSNFIVNLIFQYKGDRKKAFNIILFKAFGTKVNQKAFQKLGEIFDWKMVSKLNHDPVLCQAYLFGIAGMLNQELEDRYFLSLVRDYQYLKKVFELRELKYVEWKFSTMRPSNLPTVRIAQLSCLLLKDEMCSEHNTLAEIKSKLIIELSDYWKNHYMFGRKGKKINSALTDEFIDLLIINVFVPYVFAIGTMEGNDSLKSKALNWLEDVKPEKNKIIKNWQRTGLNIMSGFESQALIEQKNGFCAKSLCLECKIGQKLLKEENALGI